LPAASQAAGLTLNFKAAVDGLRSFLFGCASAQRCVHPHKSGERKSGRGLGGFACTARDVSTKELRETGSSE
jgi:hypothetical protein